MAKPENIVTSIRVEIEAPAALVWEVLVDLPRYREWNSFCPEIESTLEIGAAVRMKVRPPGSLTLFPNVEYLTAIENERLLSWDARPTAENKDAARRDQYVESLGTERCAYWSTDIFLGLNEDRIMREHGAWVKQAFDQTALELKTRAEALFKARRSA